MSQNSNIEWTEATWNCLAGCSEISPGCLHCYAAIMAHRLAAMGQKKYIGTTKKLPNGKIVWTGNINTDEEALTIPLKRKKPTTYFVNSMSDLFHEDVPFEYIDQVFTTMCLAEWHTFQVLTKRAERMAEYFSTYRKSGIMPCLSSRFKDMPDGGILCAPLDNVWLGVSVEDQKRADERIPHLLRTPAVVRFLSCEPLLGPVDLKDHLGLFEIGDDQGKSHWGQDTQGHRGIDWVICGGESGHGSRPCDIAWIRSLVEQCKAAGVACFVKQLGSNPHDTTKNAGLAPGVASARFNVRWTLKDTKGGNPSEWPEDLLVREMPTGKTVTT